MVTISKYENGFFNAYYQNGSIHTKNSKRVSKKYNEDNCLVSVSYYKQAYKRGSYTEFNANGLMINQNRY